MRATRPSVSVRQTDTHHTGSPSGTQKIHALGSGRMSVRLFCRGGRERRGSDTLPTRWHGAPLSTTTPDGSPFGWGQCDLPVVRPGSRTSRNSCRPGMTHVLSGRGSAGTRGASLALPLPSSWCPSALCVTPVSGCAVRGVASVDLFFVSRQLLLVDHHLKPVSLSPRTGRSADAYAITTPFRGVRPSQGYGHCVSCFALSLNRIRDDDAKPGQRHATKR